MELHYFRGLQDKQPSVLKAKEFLHANLALARSKTRHMLIADYAKQLEGSVVISCPTIVMCEAIAKFIPNSVCIFGSHSKEEREEAIRQYGVHGILITSTPMLPLIHGLRQANNLVFTHYTYFGHPFISRVNSIGVKHFHQIVDNVPLRGVLPEAFLRLERVISLNRVSDFEEFTKF